MITRTLSGAPFLDEPHGGVYANRSFLVCGRAGVGKTAMGFQFVRQGIQQDERCLVLSTMAANDLTILAESLGFSFAVPIDQGHLILLEYQSFIPGQGTPDWGPLPPEGFDQLREIIEGNSISRVVLDSVLPWISVTQADLMSRHVFSFVRSCDRLGVTTLMTMPKPVSSMAFRLKKTVEDVVPISVLLSPSDDPHRFLWQTVKYLGEKSPGRPMPYTVEKETGLTLAPIAAPVDSSPPRPAPTPPASAPTPAPAAPAPTPAPSAPEPQGPVRFSSVLFTSRPDPDNKDREGRAPPRNVVPGEPARLAKVWKPDLNPSSSSGGPG